MEGSRSEEFKRLIELSELDLDYGNLEDHLEDLTKLAARIVGTEVSLVNLIDSYTQWSVADYGIDVQQMPREESVCHYTIKEKDSLEIKNLADDDRFREKPYVTKGLQLKYYYGVPLQTSNGANIGALCVLDPEPQNISPEKKELLKLIGKQVVRRLEALKKINDLQTKVEELGQTQRKVSHDIRNPISGIIGIAQIMKDEIKNERINEVLELVEMIEQGGNSLLEMVEDIMDREDANKQSKPGENQFDCNSFCQKLKELYGPQAKSKDVELNVKTLEESDNVVFSRSRLLQIVGNLITNSIKFTEAGGRVDVEVCVIETDAAEKSNKLRIKVEDTGVGMEAVKIEEILEGNGTSESGTGGEKGYGFGLSLVRHLVDKAEGEMKIDSEPGKGTSFVIILPV